MTLFQILLLAICCLCSLLALPARSGEAPTPPSQPATGPGGSTLPHSSVTSTIYETGRAEYWIYEPAAPVPATAPVIVFLHGWGGTNPAAYGNWIDHLVRRGNIVIYPRYQADLTTPAEEFTPNAIMAVRSALTRLQRESGHVRPLLDQFAIVGHSAGGVLTANLAALAAESGLPVVRAAMAVEPGTTIRNGRPLIALSDLGKIPADTLLLTVAGESDNFVGETDAKRIFLESRKVPLVNKDYIILPTDQHGSPALLGGHSAPLCLNARYDNGQGNSLTEQLSGEASSAHAPQAPEVRSNTPGSTIPAPRVEPENDSPSILREMLKAKLRNYAGGTTPSKQAIPELRDAIRNASRTDALDYYGLWKLFDGLCDAAFFQMSRSAALGNTPEQRYMGRWSDGTPVKELIVTDHP